MTSNAANHWVLEPLTADERLHAEQTARAAEAMAEGPSVAFRLEVAAQLVASALYDAGDAKASPEAQAEVFKHLLAHLLHRVDGIAQALRADLEALRNQVAPKE